MPEKMSGSSGDRSQKTHGAGRRLRAPAAVGPVPAEVHESPGAAVRLKHPADVSGGADHAAAGRTVVAARRRAGEWLAHEAAVPPPFGRRLLGFGAGCAPLRPLLSWALSAPSAPAPLFSS